jgi:hypothetical protein
MVLEIAAKTRPFPDGNICALLRGRHLDVVTDEWRNWCLIPCPFVDRIANSLTRRMRDAELGGRD